MFWRYPAQIALFFFGLVNGGVPLQAFEAGAWALPVATIVGRPLGLLAGVAFARAIGMHMPNRLSWRSLVPLGFATVSGFSVGLFFTTALIPPGQLRSEISLGVLFTAVFGPILALVTGGSPEPGTVKGRRRTRDQDPARSPAATGAG